MLHEFRVSILPIVLKNGENQKNVVRKILQVDLQVCFSFSSILHHAAGAVALTEGVKKRRREKNGGGEEQKKRG